MCVARNSMPYSNTHNIIVIDAINISHYAPNAKNPLCAITVEVRRT